MEKKIINEEAEKIDQMQLKIPARNVEEKQKI